VPVRRPANLETTVLGAAYLAGLAEDVWASPADAAVAWHEDAAFLPTLLPRADERRAEWRRAVDRTRGWANPDA
jgi:glycerol kinase